MIKKRLISVWLALLLVFGCALSAGCLWLFVEKLSVHAIVAKLMTITLVTAVQFALNKVLTFRKVSATTEGRHHER